MSKLHDDLMEFGDLLGNLRDRWMNEGAYEDFNDYVNVMKKNLPEGATFVKANKRPFSCALTMNGQCFTVRVTSSRCFLTMAPVNRATPVK